MPKLADLVFKVRSKNAGPFWLTIDVFCGSRNAYEHVVRGLATEQVAAAFGQPVEVVKRFDIQDLDVVKFSMPRPVVQGSRFDRDMHGAQWSLLVEALEVDA